MPRIPDVDWRKVAVPVALAVLVLAGMVTAFLPGMYTYDIRFDQSEGEVTVTFGSDVGVETTSVLISNTGSYAVTYVAAYEDEGYAALNSWSSQRDMFEDMGKLLSIRGIGFGTHDSEGILEIIRTADPGSTAIMIASGSISDLVYDGTDDSPLIDWLRRGGVVVNTAGCLGKHVSHGPSQDDIETVYDYGFLFAGADDSDFNESGKAVYASAGCNEEVRDALHFYMNEYTYGIRSEGIQESLNVGYVSADGYSAALLFRSYEGMVMNFGASMSTHEHSDHYIAQIIASGMDYGSEIVAVETGDTRGDRTDTFAVSGNGCVYAFMGSTRALCGERFDFRTEP